MTETPAEPQAPTPDTLRAALAKARRESRLTLRALADAVGVDFTYLSKIEHGHDRPSRDLVVRLDSALDAGTALVDLFDGLPCPRCGRRSPRGRRRPARAGRRASVTSCRSARPCRT